MTVRSDHVALGAGLANLGPTDARPMKRRPDIVAMGAGLAKSNQGAGIR